MVADPTASKSAKAKAKSSQKSASKARVSPKPVTEARSVAKAKPAAVARAKVAAKAAARAKPTQKAPAKPVARLKPATPGRAKRGAKKRQPSKHPEAVRSRRRRRDQRGIDDQLRAIEDDKRARAKIARRAKRRGAPMDERRRAIGWLERIREIVSHTFRCSLDVTEPVSGAKRPEDEHPDAPAVRQRDNMRHTVWLVVGRFDAHEDVGYLELANALEDVSDDILLEASVHPQRLSQIRVVYSDPHAKGGEGDSIVSKIGGWQFILSDLIAEMVGTGSDDSDALAVRYAETQVPTFYIYFSVEIINYVTASPWVTVRTR